MPIQRFAERRWKCCCADIWVRCVCTWVTGIGLMPSAADDLLQDFIAGKVLVDQLIPRADRQRGRFRTFLLTALDRFVANQFRFDSAQKRAPMAPQCATLQNLAVCEDGPDASKAFDIAWARQLIRNAIEQMQRECQSNGRLDVWDVFEARVLEPMLEGAQPVAYDVLAERSAPGDAVGCCQPAYDR